jgi:hypothetical protein
MNNDDSPVKTKRGGYREPRRTDEARPRDYATVFGEFYLRENDATLAAVQLASENPGKNYAVRYDCVEGLYRVVVMGWKLSRLSPEGDRTMAAKQSVTVIQLFNPRFNSTKPKDDAENPEHGYKVKKTVNTMRVKIGQYLRPSEVQQLIDNDVTVTIQPVK